MDSSSALIKSDSIISQVVFQKVLIFIVAAIHYHAALMSEDALQLVILVNKAAHVIGGGGRGEVNTGCFAQLLPCGIVQVINFLGGEFVGAVYVFKYFHSNLYLLRQS
jgi:hypothetical protein